MAMRSAISSFERQILAQRALQRHVPLRDTWGVQMRRHAGDLKLSARVVDRIEYITVREALRSRRPDEIERRVVARRRKAPRPDLLEAVIDSVTSSQNGCRSDFICESQPRRKIGFVRLD